MSESEAHKELIELAVRALARLPQLSAKTAVTY